MLATVLILLVLLLVAGIAFLGARVLQYRSSVDAASTAQALALAEAGLEDARVKLEKDYHFPPPGSDEQLTFTYTEDLPEVTSGAPASYEVTVDTTYTDPPYSLIQVTVIGTVGPRDKPLARRKLTAEYDVGVWDRQHPDQPNPTLGKFINLTDGGGF